MQKNSEAIRLINILNSKENKACSSVDRASDSGPGGRGFDSRHAYYRLFS